MVRPAGLARASAIVTMSVVVAVVDPTAAAASEVSADTSAFTDRIPEHVALIYDYAAATAPCAVSFATLAGIGDVASDHTRLGGTSRLLPDGNSEPTIVYERLDPAAPSGLVPDTDGGATDGSTEADTTVGPMQFLPETWAKYGVDGNGDGTADPDNLWDAAAGAANRLCEASVDTDLPGALTAYFGTDRYNDWVAESIAESAEWQAAERPSPERRELEVVSIAPPRPPRPRVRSRRPLPSRPLPSRPLPSRPLPSRPLPSRPLPSRPLPSRPLPSRPLPSRSLPSRPLRSRPPRAPPTRSESPVSSRFRPQPCPPDSSGRRRPPSTWSRRWWLPGNSPSVATGTALALPVERC